MYAPFEVVDLVRELSREFVAFGDSLDSVDNERVTHHLTHVAEAIRSVAGQHRSHLGLDELPAEEWGGADVLRRIGRRL